MAMLDTAENVIDVKASFCRLLKLSPEKLLGRCRAQSFLQSHRQRSSDHFSADIPESSHPDLWQ